MKKIFFRFWPVIFILGVWLVFVSPYSVKQKIPYPANYLTSYFTPWNEYPEYKTPVKNNAISDVVNQLYPWKYFTIEELKKGSLPVWNPYSFSGTPHLANYQSAVWTPFNLLFFILPFIDAWSLLILLPPLLAGWFLYLYLRELKVSDIGSVIGSVAFMFCGFVTVWMPYGTLSMAVVFLPLALFAIEKNFARSQIRYSLLLAVSLVISFFSGHFQMSLYVACFVLAYLVFAFSSTKDTRALYYSLGGFVFGMIVSLLQIIPSLEFYGQAIRSEFFSNVGAIPWYYLVTAFAPDFFGNPVTRNDWVGHYAEWASFIGIVPLALAFAALFVKKNKTILFFFITGIVTLLLALDTPLQQLLAASKLPIFSTSIPSRIILLFSFSFAVLAGFGFDGLLERLQKKHIKQIVVVLLPAAVLIFGIWAVISVFPVLPADKLRIAERNLLLPTVLFAIVVMGVFCAGFIKKKYLVTIVAVVLLLLTTFDSWRFVQKWIPFEDRNALYPKVPVIQAMQKEVGEGRVYGDFGAYLSMYYHLPVVDGYDPLYSKRYGELIQSAKTGKFTPALRSEVILDRTGKYTQRLLDILGVTLIYQPIAHSNQPWAFPVWKDPNNFPTLYRDDKFAVFANDSVMPRVQIFTQYEVINDPKKLIERFFDKDFDFRNVLLLEEEPGISQNKELNPTNEAKIVSYSPNKVVVSATAAKPGLLFLSDSYYPGWKVSVNGKEEKIYAADHALRAVKVPVGKSEVIFNY